MEGKIPKEEAFMTQRKLYQIQISVSINKGLWEDSSARGRSEQGATETHGPLPDIFTTGRVQNTFAEPERRLQSNLKVRSEGSRGLRPEVR